MNAITFKSFLLAVCMTCAVSSTTFGSPAIDPAPKPLPPLFAVCEKYCALVNAKGEPVTQRIFGSLGKWWENKPGPLTSTLIWHGHNGLDSAINRRGEAVIQTTDNLREILPGLWLQYPAENPSNGDISTGKPESKTYTLYAEDGRKIWQDILPNLDTETSGSVHVKTWARHPYLEIPCNPTCRWLFPDLQSGHGYRAEFIDFSTPRYAPEPTAQQPYAKATIQTPAGPRTGFIDASLAFAIPPKFTGALDFENTGFARVWVGDGAKNAAIIARTGAFVVPAGLYDNLYPPTGDSDQFITGVNDKPQRREDSIRVDGTRINFPDGLRAFSSYKAAARGYIVVVNEAGRFGTTDLDGKLLIPAVHENLQGLDSKHLIFGVGNPRIDPRYGILDRHGKIILPAHYRYIAEAESLAKMDQFLVYIPGANFLAAGSVFHCLDICEDESTSWTLINAKGKRLLPPTQFRNIKLLSSQVLSAETRSNTYELYRPDGTALSITSATEVYSYKDEGRPDLVRVALPGNDEQQGVMNAEGKMIFVLPSNFHHLRPIDDRLFGAVSANDKSLSVYDDEGRELIGPGRFREIYTPFADGAALAVNMTGKQVLIDTHGKELASFAGLFPQYVPEPEKIETGSTADPSLVAQMLDACVDQDPVAYSNAPARTRSVESRLCYYPALRARYRAVMTTYYAAQASNCDPRPILSAYDASEVRRATLTVHMSDNQILAWLDEFETAIKSVTQPCKTVRSPVASEDTGVPKKPRDPNNVTPAIQKTLLRMLKKLDTGREGPLPDYRFNWLVKGNRQAVVVKDESESRMGGGRLFARNAAGQWHMTFNEYADFEAITPDKMPYPDLLGSYTDTPPNLRNAYRWNGRRYVEMYSCIDHEGNPPLSDCAIAPKKPKTSESEQAAEKQEEQ